MAGKSIEDLCKEHWKRYKGDCSGLVKAVANDLGLDITGNANAIVDQMGRAPWKTLATGRLAEQSAAAGNFVVAGLKATGHGHVAIIVPGALNRGLYPTAYWGKFGSIGKQATTINWSWNRTDRDLVLYARLVVSSAPTKAI